MRALRIIKCSDSMLWYARLVGQVVELVREIDIGYYSREPAGYLNIVRRDDAEIIEETYEANSESGRSGI